MAWTSKNFLLQWVFSGLLLGIGFIFPTLWTAGLIGGAYFLYLLLQNKSFKEKCVGAWLAWSIKAGCAMWWGWSIYPIEWISIGSSQIMFMFLYWLVAALALGIGGVLVSSLYWLVKEWLPEKQKIIISLSIFPFLWVAGEMFGSLIFSIVMSGPGGSINTAYSFGYSGYLLAEHEVLIQIARVAGVYGLSVCFALIVVAVFSVMKTRNKRYQYGLLVFLLIVHVSSFFVWHKTEAIDPADGYKVISIETNFGSNILRNVDYSFSIATALNEAMTVALQQEPDYVVLPEGTSFFDRVDSTVKNKFLSQVLYDKSDSIVIDSSSVPVAEGFALQAFIYDGSNNSVSQVQKQYLVPQGEFVPTLFLSALNLFGYEDVAKYITKKIALVVGPLTSQKNLSNEVPGILFCFEGVSPQGVRDLVKDRPGLPFVAHPVSHAWFHEPQILWHHLDNMLRVQAIWNQKYIVSASNQAISKTITPNGEVIIPLVIADGNSWAIREVFIPF